MTSYAWPISREQWDDGRPVYSKLQTIAAAGASFPASTAHGIAGTQERWIEWVRMHDGTESYLCPGGACYFTGTGIQGWRVTATNIESSKAGDLDWTGFAADVLVRYTLV